MKPKLSSTKKNCKIRFQTKNEVPWTEGPLLFTLDLSGWRFLEPVVNIEKCNYCGTCYIFCPTGCIVDKGTYYEVNLKFCKGCGICARECPIRAITMVEGC